MAVKERNSSLDLIRILAAFCVVVNHATEYAYSFSGNVVASMTTKSKLFAFSDFTFGRIGVTLFLLLTGYLLLNREYDEQKIKRFYKHNLLPLVICWQVWLIIYEIFSALVYKIPFNFELYIRRVFFLYKGVFPHAWYMPMIIGMYLFLPLVAMVIRKMKAVHILILLGICFGYAFIVPAIVVYQNTIQVVPLSNQFDLTFGGGTYGVYLITGYLLSRYKEKVDNIMRRAWAIIGAILIGIGAFVCTVVFQIKIYALNGYYTVWYNFPGMVIMGVCIFLVLSQIRLKGFISRIISHMASCAFGIYLVHEIFLNTLRLNIGYLGDSSTLFIIYVVVTFAVSYACVGLLSLIPKVGYYLFMKK